MSSWFRKCCVPGCTESGKSHKTLHIFPHPDKDRERFNVWVYSISGEIIGLRNEVIYKNRWVCHLHFEEKFQCSFNRISNIAIPTLNLPGVCGLRSGQSTPSTSQTLSGSLAHAKFERQPLTQIQLNLESKPSTTSDPQMESRTNIVVDDKEKLDVYSGAVKENTDPVMIQPQKSIEPNKEAPNINLATKSERKNRDQSKAANKRGTGKIVKKNITVTPAEQKLYKKLLQVRIKLSKCRNKVKQQSANLKAAKNITTNQSFLATLENFSSSAKIFTMMQFREFKKKTKGKRFTVEEKILALSIFKQAPKGYRYLRKLFTLPAPQTLAKLLNLVNLEPGINSKIFQQLKNITQNMKREERLCVLLFDEMFLRAGISYNERRDRTIGFATDGQEVRPDFADHAQVYMIRGLIKNYKQPVSYSFSAAATSGQQIAKQIKQIIKELHDAGLIVVATICDQGANNRSAYKLLLQETRGVYLRKGEEPKKNIFIVNEQEIVPLYDPPHLLKCVRNNFLTKNLVYTINGIKKTAKWEHIQKLHTENPAYKGIRLIPKLTDGHIVPHKIPKMKVKFASQVFSRTVATNMGYLAGNFKLKNVIVS